LIGSVALDFSSLAGDHLGDNMSPGDQSNGIEESPKRRQSVRFQRNQPFTDPPSLETTRLLPVLKTRYLFFCGLDLRLLSKFPFNPSREIIQHEWNKIARKAGAAEIEFVNQTDEEELPPGIGTLFPYVERKYIL
jgi:hypothetical protein